MIQKIKAKVLSHLMKLRNQFEVIPRVMNSSAKLEESKLRMSIEGGLPDHNMESYQKTYSEYRSEIAEYFNFGFDVIDTFAENPTSEMMLWVGADATERRLSYVYFRDRSNQLVNALNSLGLKKGDHVMLVNSFVPEWWESMIGMIKAGIISVPGQIQLTERDIKYRLEASHIRGVICDSDNAPKFDALRKSSPELKSLIIVGEKREGWYNYETLVSSADKFIRPINRVRTHKDDPMLLYFTSGTTGHPRMVLHTHSYPVGHVVTGKFWLDLRPGDLHWNMSTNTGWAKAAWSSLFGPLVTGASIFVHNTKGKYSPRLTLDLLSKYKVTSFCTLPTAYQSLIVENLKEYDLSSLRSCVAAGEPLSPQVIDTWRDQTGITIRNGYGLTETVILVGNFPVDDAPVKPGSLGKPAPGSIVDVIDDKGEPLPTDIEGDIAVRIKPQRPLGLFREYWGNPEATEATHRGDWYVTGDRGYRDQDGYLWWVARADDVIISSGFRIGPFEVESALVEHPAVLESAVVAKPDPIRGEIVKAFVVLKPGFEPSDKLVTELQGFVKSITASYKCPREIEFIKELPKTVSGKIRRIDLRQKLAKTRREYVDQRAEYIFQQLPVAIALSDDAHRVVYNNRAFLELASKESQEDVQGKNFMDLFGVDPLDNIEESGGSQWLKLEKVGRTAKAYNFSLPEEDLRVLMLLDITETVIKDQQADVFRTETIHKAHQVIHEQMRVAQEIAGLLGETTAETKAALFELIKLAGEGGATR